MVTIRLPSSAHLQPSVDSIPDLIRELSVKPLFQLIHHLKAGDSNARCEPGLYFVILFVAQLELFSDQ